MNEIDNSELAALDPRRLTQEQQSELRQRLILRAQTARGEALRDIAGGVPKILRAAVRGSHKIVRGFAERAREGGRYWWNAWRLRRQRRAAIRELAALDDRMLRDIGLGRSEIESVVGDVERLMEREFATLRPFLQARAPDAGKCRQKPRPMMTRVGKSAA